MPQIRPISYTLRETILEAFQATAALVRPELQRRVILVGGAASAAHKSPMYT